jgi:hypothetical protein
VYFAFISSELLLDEGEELGLGLEDAAQLLDELHEFEVLGLDLAALEPGELVEAEFEDGVGLALGERVLRHQGAAWPPRGWRRRG